MVSQDSPVLRSAYVLRMYRLTIRTCSYPHPLSGTTNTIRLYFYHNGNPVDADVNQPWLLDRRACSSVWFPGSLWKAGLWTIALPVNKRPTQHSGQWGSRIKFVRAACYLPPRQQIVGKAGTPCYRYACGSSVNSAGCVYRN